MTFLMTWGSTLFWLWVGGIIPFAVLSLVLIREVKRQLSYPRTIWLVLTILWPIFIGYIVILLRRKSV